MLITASARRRLLPSTIRLLSTASQGAPAHEDYDVVIVGGGPAGLALAGALSSSSIVRQNVRIALIEAGDLAKIRDWQLPPNKYSNRVSSLTNASHAFLKKINAWNYVQDERTCPVDHMEVWDGISDARISFDAAEMGVSPGNQGMAKLTENLNLQRGLLHLLDKTSDVDLIHRTKVASIVRESEERGAWPIVNLDSGRRLRARLLVGADGFNSPVRAYAQIPSFGWSYDTQGVVATLVHHPRGSYEGPNTTAFQRFLPTGPIAFLPLSPTVSSLVWSTRPHIAQALQASDPSVLICLINAAFRLPQVSLQYLYNRIFEAQATGNPLTAQQIQEEIMWREKSHGIYQHSALSSSTASGVPVGIPPTDSELVPPLVTSIQEGTVASFPLRFNHTESYLGEGMGARTVLVGDAAHTIHPLAGQGLNLGLGDVECLAKCIETAILQGSDIGSYTTLHPYTQKQYPTNHTIMAAVDKLHKIYTTDFEPVVWARSTGLEVINELDSLKTAIMMTAGAGAQKSSGWGVVTEGLETLEGAVKVARTVGEGIGGIVNANLETLVKRVAGRPKA